MKDTDHVVSVGDTLRRAREGRSITLARAARALGLPVESYIQVESGESGIEDWGVLLARVAVVLSTPMSRLIPAAGASVDATRHSVGALVCEARKRRNLTEEHLARRLGLSTDAYRRVEGGLTPIEHWSRAAHRYAELVEQPVFNLFAAALTSHEMPRRAAAR